MTPRPKRQPTTLSIKIFEGCNNLLPWSSRPGHPENPSGGLPLFYARGRGPCLDHLPCIQSLNKIISGRGVLWFLALLSPLAVCPSSPSESLLERPGVVAVSSCPSLVRPRLSCSHLGCCQLSIVCRPDACVCRHWYCRWPARVTDRAGPRRPCPSFYRGSAGAVPGGLAPVSELLPT